MKIFKAFLATAVAFLVVDAIWIVAVVSDYYRSVVSDLLRDAPNMGAAAVFYLAYAGGLVYLAVLPAVAAGSARTALARGAVTGAIAYGTYTVTNYALLQGWTMGLVVSDVLWGAFLSALSAGCGYLACSIHEGGPGRSQ